MKGWLLACLLLPGMLAAQRQMAITIDDLPKAGRVQDLEAVRRANRQMLDALVAAKVPAVGFVNERGLHVPDEVDERIAVLRMWLDAGMTLGNHTFSHPSLHDTPLQKFQDDVLHGEVITRRLMRERGHTRFYFRHPFTRTGPSREVKEAFEAFLTSRGYTVAPFTIENSDFAFAAIYVTALQEGKPELAARVSDAYLEYTEVMCDYFERRSREILGYEVKQILLIHVNELNAAVLPELLRKLQARRYSFITLDEALTDKAYQIPDRFIGPQGLSWVHRWTVHLGQPMKFQEEPDPPKFILDLYRASQR